VAIEVKFCKAKRTQVSVGPAKFDVNRCNESPLQGEKADFWPVSKFNTGSLPLRGILPVINKHHIFAPTAGDLHQTLHGDRSRRVHQKSRYSLFDPTHSFSYRVHGIIGANLPTRGFSAITP